ncbi:MAG: DNA-damage-inducible protein D [uncultured Sulfurovum sp.]|uniref:DNA-damage-inducible protein D n=1 Tax=uncultured Sulfurovum sp. TaxID=269237 RepID=A0A6S6U184_9BACT|nr:MAG: DNA-damage-inducible protein D [uncultured Sulfurovum sp.]
MFYEYTLKILLNYIHLIVEGIYVKEIEISDYKTFEDIKQIDVNGNEFWYARALAQVLDYSDFRNFTKVIEKVKISLENNKEKIIFHIVDIEEEVVHGKGATKKYPSFALSRFACYLIVQNADPSKSVIAKGQAYFALQTRRQELEDEDSFKQLQEDEKRLFLRNELKEHNKQLVATAQEAGVKTNIDFAVFQNYGYKGLYGLDARGIHTKKGLKKSHKILDHMGSTELAANLFHATQTEEKLKRDKVQSKRNANKTHYDVGKKVRDTIEELGGEMPENLPTPEKSLIKIEKEQKKLEKK